MWKRYRIIAASVQAALILGLPFVQIRGQSALRFDIPDLRLYFFGTVIGIDEFYLLLFATVFSLLLIVALTVSLGRVWCGWACPQTVLLGIAGELWGWSAKRPWLMRLLLLPLTALAAMSMIWYFVPPMEALRGLADSKVMQGFFLTIWAVLFIELAFVGRMFCRSVCPYSMLQSGLYDPQTLVVTFDEARRDECMGCELCTKVCPVGIDIKDGLSRRCVACAQCIDACQSRMSRRGLASLVGYRGKVIRPKTLALAGLCLIVALAMTAALAMRPEVKFVVIRDAAQQLKGVNVYHYTIKNNTSRVLELEFSVEGPVEVSSEAHIVLAPYESRKGRAIVRPTGTQPPRSIVFQINGLGSIALKQEVGYM